MTSEGVKDTRRLLSDSPSMSFRVPATYDRFMHRTKKLGQTATQTIGSATQGARQFLGQPQRHELIAVDDVDDLKKVVAQSREVLASARTVLPFLFPHQITLDRTQVTITKRNFFWSADVISIRIEDVLNVSCSVGPLFGGVTVASRVMSTIDHFKVENFWRDEANQMKQVIQGYLIARQNGIQTDHLSCKELVDTFCELGKTGE